MLHTLKNVHMHKCTHAKIWTYWGVYSYEYIYTYAGCPVIDRCKEIPEDLQWNSHM